MGLFQLVRMFELAEGIEEGSERTFAKCLCELRGS